MDEENEDRMVKLVAIVRRAEYYQIEVTVPEYYSYDQMEDAVQEKYKASFTDESKAISPYDVDEYVWHLDEEPVDEQDT